MSFAVQLEKRVEDIVKAVEQSAGNHNGLLGRLAEAKHLLDEFLAFAKALEEVAAPAPEAHIPDAHIPA